MVLFYSVQNLFGELPAPDKILICFVNWRAFALRRNACLARFVFFVDEKFFSGLSDDSALQ
jgi:hypothetical protein